MRGNRINIGAGKELLFASWRRPEFTETMTNKTKTCPKSHVLVGCHTQETLSHPCNRPIKMKYLVDPDVPSMDTPAVAKIICGIFADLDPGQVEYIPRHAAGTLSAA